MAKTLTREKFKYLKSKSQPSTPAKVRKIAYIMSRFPKLTETFILYEMLAMEEAGVQVENFPLLRERQKVSHREALRLTEVAHFHPFISLSILFAQVYFLFRKPAAYLKVWFEVLRGTLGSFNFFLGALGILPKSVRFAYEMERLGVQHVHAHFANHPAVAAFIVSRLTGIPYSFTAHGSDLHKDRTMLDVKIKASAFAVTVSEYNKELMVNEAGEETHEKIQVIHCGVDTDLFKPQPEKTEGKMFEILCVASYEEVKGHKYLVEACQQLAERGLDFTCHLVGEGPLRRVVQEQVIALGLSERFQIHGGLPRPEIIKLHARADVFVLASVPTKSGKREGIPVVLMEAMSSGLPVVSSELSGIPELVRNGASGILVSPGDVNGIVKAIKKLYDSPEFRSRMGNAGRDIILNDFDLKKNSLKLLNLIKSHSFKKTCG